MAYEKLKDENYLNLGGISSKLSEYITPEKSVLDLRNLGFERPGAWTSRNGTTAFASFANTTLMAQPTGLFQYRKSTGESLTAFDSGNTLYSYASPPLAIAPSLSPGSTIGYNIDFAQINDYLYFANRFTFQRYNLSYSVFYGVPKMMAPVSGAGGTFHTSLISTISSTLTIPSGFHRFMFSYVKDGPTITPGPIGEIFSGNVTSASEMISVSLSATLVVAPFVGRWVVHGMTIPPGWGVSSLVMYKNTPPNLSFIASPSLLTFGLTNFSGSTQFNVNFDHFTTDNIYLRIPQFSLAPSILQTYKNMLFMTGSSRYPSKVHFSEQLNSDSVLDENFFDVRPGNNDVITNMINFQDSLVIFKRKSVHQLTGNSPETLSMKDMSIEYGCVNNTAAVEFEGRLWFMDDRGICEYRGSDTEIVSYQVDDVMATVDKTKCRAFHIKKRQEVWFCCGTISFVYDYNVESWTIYDGFNIENSKAAQVIDHGASIQDLSFINTGASNAIFTRFSDDVYSDLGSAITLSVKTRFHKRLGDSTQEIWRRLYVNSNASNATAIINLYGNYANSSSFSTNIYLDSFQKRIDFGYVAKSLSVEMILKSSQKVVINGYTIESRFMRLV